MDDIYASHLVRRCRSKDKHCDCPIISTALSINMVCIFKYPAMYQGDKIAYCNGKIEKERCIFVRNTSKHEKKVALLRAVPKMKQPPFVHEKFVVLKIDPGWKQKFDILKDTRRKLQCGLIKKSPKIHVSIQIVK
jgi:hypothetical protein